MTDQPKWTPGPWVSPYELFDHGWGLESDGENSYVGVGPKSAGATMTPIAIVAVESAFGTGEILDANARLIAAAPELYEALEKCRVELESIARCEFEGVWFESDFAELIAPYDAVLAKARGEA